MIEYQHSPDAAHGSLVESTAYGVSGAEPNNCKLQQIE